MERRVWPACDRQPSAVNRLTSLQFAALRSRASFLVTASYITPDSTEAIAMDGVMAVEALAHEPLECGCDRCLFTQKNLVLHGHMQARVQAQVWKPDARPAMMLHRQLDLLALVGSRPSSASTGRAGS
jgi:hypothetical protein